MVDALRDNNIDAAILWSLTAETFSFALHEALAAGCFIITNRHSGNIQYYIRQNPKYGIVLENDKELIELLQSNKLEALIAEYQANGIPQAVLLPNGLTKE